MTTSMNSGDSEGSRSRDKGRLIGPKPPLQPRPISAIRIRLELGGRGRRDLALVDLAIDSKLRGCNLVRLRVQDVARGGQARSSASVVQRKTGQPVKFELTEQARQAVKEWIASAGLRSGDYLFPSRLKGSPHLPPVSA